MIPHQLCEEAEHTWQRAHVTILTDEESPRLRSFPSERCTTCGLLRRTRGADGALLPALDETDPAAWHQVPTETLY